MTTRPTRLALPATFTPANLEEQIRAQVREINQAERNLGRLREAGRIHPEVVKTRLHEMWSVYHSLLKLEAGQGSAAQDAG